MTEKQLSDVLLSIRTDVLLSRQNPRYFMDKYDMLFLGENCSTINLIELRHSIKKCFDIDVEMNELLELTPKVCRSLNMKLEPMKSLPSNSDEIVSYLVTLI